MLDNGISILNFDNSITVQHKLLLQYCAEIIDLTSLASSARLYISKALRKKISALLGALTKNYPVFLGSGDFHHISEILISKINEPFCLIIFDFHPDWDTFPPRFACGSWVSEALQNKNISNVYLSVWVLPIYPFLHYRQLISSFSCNRLEIYPYKHKPSRVYF